MAINLNKKKQNDAVDYITRSYKSALEFQRPLFTKYNDWYQMYRAIRADSQHNYVGRARLFIPYVFATIETIIPRLIGAKPNIKAIPREANDFDNADINTSLFDYEWDMMDMRKKLKNWVKETLIYGTGILKLYWEFKEDDSTVLIDQAQAELVDLFDFFPDPNATNMSNARYAIHRTERDLESLKNNPNYDIPAGLVSSVSEDTYKVQRDAILGLTKPADKNSKKVEILEYWGEYDLGNGVEQCLMVVANKQYIIRAEPSPYDHKQIPFIRMVDVEDPFSFWGIGEVEQLQSLQYELNDVRNQRMDNVTLILNRMWKVNKNADVDEQDLISQAGQVVHVGEMTGLEPIVTPDVTQSAYNEESLIKSDMQFVSGVNDVTMGGTQGKGPGQAGVTNDTATGIMLLQEAGNARFKYKLDNIEDSLRDFGKQLLALNQQFMDSARQLRIVGDGKAKYIEIQPADISGQYDIQVEAGSTQPMSKTVRRAEARELLNTVLPFVQFGLDIKYFIKYLLQTYDLMDIDEAFPEQNPLAGAMPGLPQEGMGADQAAASRPEPQSTPGNAAVTGVANIAGASI